MKTQSGRDDSFDRFSHSFDRWKELVRPFGSAQHPNGPTYRIEVGLDHITTHLLSLGNEAASRSTKIDWSKIVPENLADLDALESRLDALAIPEEQKSQYRIYISECRAIWEQMRSLPVPPEGHLGFRNTVLSNFQFLETLGFQVTESSPIRVRYQSEKFFVDLELSAECPELIFSLGDLPEGDRAHLFSLDDFLYLAGLGLFFDYSRFNLESKSGIEALVSWSAQLIKDHAKPVLRGESGAWKVLTAKQNERERAIGEQGTSDNKR